MLQNKIRRGELDRAITFVQGVVNRGNSNQDEIAYWTPIAIFPTVYARKVETKGSELVVADQIQYIQKTVFTIVYRTDLSVKYRVRCEGKVYEIISVTENGPRKMYLDVVTNLLDKETYT